MIDHTSQYPVHVFWSDEDEEFVAIAPDLPGSSAFGESREQALAELNVVIEGWLEAARAAGNPIPKPSKPLKDSQHSGRLLLRMPPVLHAELVPAAKEQNVSLNSFVVYLITDGLATYSEKKSQEEIKTTVKELGTPELRTTIYTHETSTECNLIHPEVFAKSFFKETIGDICDYWESGALSSDQMSTQMGKVDEPILLVQRSPETARRHN